MRNPKTIPPSFPDQGKATLSTHRDAPHTRMDGPANGKDVTLRKELSVLLPPSASGHEFSAEWKTKKEIQCWLLGSQREYN